MLRFLVNPAKELTLEELQLALLNYIYAQQNNEEFVVRIAADTAHGNTTSHQEDNVALLELFGVQYSQIIDQKQNFRFHSAMALQLLHEKKAFNCFCSDEYLQKKRQEALLAKEQYRYDDACRDLPAELVIDNTAPFRVRITAPSKTIEFRDLVLGRVAFEPAEMESFIILHQDKTPTKVFANSVDDMLSDISTVIRLRSSLKETPQEIHVRKELGYSKEIIYAHIPTIPNTQDITVKTLLQEGYLPEAILNYLISLSFDTPKKIFTLQEALKWFDVSKISASPTSFDKKALREINRMHLQSMDAKELSTYVGFADAEIGELARLYLDEAATTQELKSKISPLFAAREVPLDWREDFENLKKCVNSAPYFEDYHAFKEHIETNVSLNNADKLEAYIRLLLTNLYEGPDIVEVYKYTKNYLGKVTQC